MDKAEELLSSIQGVSKKLRAIKEKQLEKSNLQDFSLSHFRYIEEIYNMKNPTFVELTKQLGLNKSTVTLMIAKLIEKGYVTKTRSKEDGRIYYLSLTGLGEKIVKDYNKVYKEFVSQIVSKFDSTEIDLLVSLLQRI